MGRVFVFRKWGIGFNEASPIRYAPTIHINQPKGMFYFSLWWAKIRIYKYFKAPTGGNSDG